MNAAPDPVTVALTGVLPAAVILAALLSFPIAWLLLRWYRRSVGRSMQSAGGAAPSVAPAATGAPSKPGAPLPLLDASAGTPARSDLTDLLSAPWRAAAVYACAGGVFAAVMTIGWLMATGIEFSAVRVAVMFWTYFWPAVLGVCLVASIQRSYWRLVVVYFAIFAVLAIVATAISPKSRWYELPLFWVLTNGAPTVLLAAFLSRRIRAVGPMVLVFMVLALIGSQVPATLLSEREAALRAVSAAGSAVGLGASAIFWGMMLLGFVVFAVIGWMLLRWLGRRYERKQLSDQTLTTDALWLLFGTLQSFTLAFEGWPWFFTGFVAFAAFRAARIVGFRVLGARPRPAPRSLLLLRVFALGTRSERVFDVLQTHWLRIGNVTLIAGQDLVTTTVEPHEFLAFLAGKLSRQFVRDRADLEGRIARMDTAIDGDGRYRVSEFFCLADTWQMTMRELAARSDVVLMDLRSFSSANRGCLFELGELLNAVDLTRVVFVVDPNTDRKFLEASLGALWAAVPPQSPNRRQPGAAARVFDLTSRPSAATLRGLLAALV